MNISKARGILTGCKVHFFPRDDSQTLEQAAWKGSTTLTLESVNKQLDKSLSNLV